MISSEGAPMLSSDATSATAHSTVTEGRDPSGTPLQPWDGVVPAPVVAAVNWLTRAVFESRAGVFYAAVAALAVAKNGIWYSGNSGAWLAITRAFPNHPTLPAGEQYLIASPLGPAAAHLIGIRSSALAYGALHLVVLIAGLVLLVRGLERRGGPMAARVGVVALFATPLSNLLLIALGQQDTWTFLFLALAVCFESWPLALLAGFGLGADHLEVGVFTLASLASLRLLRRREAGEGGTAGLGADLVGTRRLIALTVGLVVGAAAVAVMEHHMGVSALQRESVIKQYGAHTLVADFLDNLPAWAFSVFCAWWVTIVALWGWLRREGLARLLVLWCALAAAVTIVTLDQTRVFALLTWALVLQITVLMCRHLPPARVRRITAVTFGAAVVLPRTIVFEGATSTANWAPIVTKILHHL